MPQDTRKYLFLMRHAEHEYGHLTASGSAHVRSLAERFSEWLEEEWRDQAGRAVRMWRTSNASEVQETADLLTREVLTQLKSGRDRLERYPFARPLASEPSPERPRAGRQPWMPAVVPLLADSGHVGPGLSAYSPEQGAFDQLCKWLRCTETDESSAQDEGHARRSELDAPLLVGNDPLIGWLASELTSKEAPVDRGELVCLISDGATGSRWRLLWTISEDGETEAEAVRAKIKSKMNTAGALGTVIVGLTTFLLQNSLQKNPTVWQWLAFAALATSAGLYFATLFLYDTLQMPPRFWASRFPYSQDGRFRRAWARLRHGSPSLARPPSSTARVLQTSMVRVWMRVFTPATILAGVGVSCLALGASSGSASYRVGLHPWQIVAAVSVLGALTGTWVAWHRPNLGSSD